MSSITLSEKSLTCPYCGKKNALIGSDLSQHTPVSCSQCGQTIGVYADLEPALADRANRASPAGPRRT